MYKPEAADVKRLREETGAGMIDCRNALVATGGDFEKAKVQLTEQGIAKAAKKAERVANEGLVGSYIHPGGKIGVLVELNCETDFVARNARFIELVRDLAMHVAAMGPEYLDRDSVPPEVADSIRSDFAKAVPAGKPPAVAEKIVEGKMNKWYEAHVLLDQQFVKDDAITVAELIAGTSGVLGERLRVRRFVRFALAEE
ncbi:MAG: translation elongation factor Ts [Candidatus Eremiobacteraeota bacterium]|nr:translation elongation factor Ts [Candidatus Eremiobacteraeota bacterium]